MKTRMLCIAMVTGLIGPAYATLLVNGDLDRTEPTEIVPGFFLPKPESWINEGSRAITGPYEDEMSSESWAGPSPTPVTANGFINGAADGLDYGLFFKAFSGNNSPDGAATGHLYQDVAGTELLTYTFTGWAGAEANFLAADAMFALEFFGSSGLISSSELSLMPTLTVDNGLAFDYKQYTVSAIAPLGTTTVRGRVSMIGGLANPSGGGQAFVVDDFELTAVPEPGTLAVLGLGALVAARRKRIR